MSTSPRDAQDEGAERQSLDELDEPHTEGDAETGEPTSLSPTCAPKHPNGRGQNH